MRTAPLILVPFLALGVLTGCSSSTPAADLTRTYHVSYPAPDTLGAEIEAPVAHVSVGWSPVHGAKQYEVQLEQQDGDGSWRLIATRAPKGDRASFLLAQGQYRFRVKVDAPAAPYSDWFGITV